MTSFYRLLIVITLLLCFSVTTHTHANEKPSEIYVVNTDLLTIRQSPSSSGTIIGTLTQGEKLTIFQHTSGWAQTYFNGMEGWVAAKYLSPVDETEVFFPNGLLSGYTIVIDPGHGGKDPGAIGHNGVLEKDLILVTAKKIAEKLREAGAKVILTRTDDYFVSLNDRVKISNSHDTDVFISIHFNAFSVGYVGGINTYYYRDGRGLAHKIQATLANELPLKNRGVIQHDYRVLRDNQPPAILIELGFITNTKELSTLQSTNFQDEVARSITIGLIEYFWE